MVSSCGRSPGTCGGCSGEEPSSMVITALLCAMVDVFGGEQPVKMFVCLWQWDCKRFSEIGSWW